MPLPAPPARPSLFASPGTSASQWADPADAQRILCSLLPPPPVIKRVPDRLWWWGAAAVLAWALLGALLGVMKREGIDRSAPAEAVTKPTAMDAVRASSGAADGITPSAQAARIEFDPRAAARVTADMPYPATEAASAVAARMMRAAEAGSVDASASKPGKRPDQTVASRPPAPSAQRRADSDVDLLEAMVAHVGAPCQAPIRPDALGRPGEAIIRAWAAGSPDSPAACRWAACIDTAAFRRPPRRCIRRGRLRCRSGGIPSVAPPRGVPCRPRLAR